ncbi:CinA family protein [Flaviflexus equikiangi]|uniref:Nicotinamide-nucleotide amidohydrolase family protein n=1 Tax=Flaviflexus equikiangi TaxID=2758573 RepID=A0ABS2TER1_9ACTO|nr:nicotinamide-nucleotide amidohydrolase family protein [Flaviflexus equikiangi]MBM9433122.1 nicotinamide-nucleotide amidohydrolase family protein [Flaviflexus equikiangi]
MKPADVLLERGDTIATAESLTGGAVCVELVETEGISAILLGAAVCYTNDMKARILDVDSALLDAKGPVCAEVAVQMARGAARLTGAEHTVSTTGVAGPGPSDGHEQGTVWIGREDGRAFGFLFRGTRPEVSRLSVIAAVHILADLDLPDEVSAYHFASETWK